MQLVNRTLDALTLLGTAPDGFSVSELAELMEIPNSSTHRILTCLKENRFVSQDPETKKYRIGYKVLTLCANITKESSFSRAARPFMKELAEKIGKTVTLCVREGHHVICIDFIESKDTSMFFVRTGFAMPLHATSAGKAIAAYLPESKVRSLFDASHAEKLTSFTKTELSDLMAELEQVRQSGFSVSNEELQLGVQGVACPIFDFSNKVVGSVSYTALKADNAMTEHNIALLKECAVKISRSIGGQL